MPPRATAAWRHVVTADDLLAGFRPEARALAEELRVLVMTVVPTAEERVYPGWRALGYRDPQAGYFCGIFPFDDHVRLLFEHGAALPDPDGLLEGATKQVRYVPLHPGCRLPRQRLARLLRAAVLDGST